MENTHVPAMGQAIHDALALLDTQLDIDVVIALVKATASDSRSDPSPAAFRSRRH